MEPNIYFLDNMSRSHIDLQHYSVSSNAVMAMATSLKINTTIKFLDLTGNAITDEAGSVLINCLSENVTLTALILRLNDLGVKTGEELAQILAKKSCQITKLDLSHNKFDDLSASRIGMSLDGKNKTLTELDMSSNEFTSNGSSHILRALDRRFLKKVSLASNKLNVVESFGVSRKLPHSLREYKSLMADLPDLLLGSVLVELDLSLTNLGDQLAHTAARVLERDSGTLEVLNMSYCMIGKAGGEALAKSMLENSFLKDLNLRGNSLG